MPRIPEYTRQRSIPGVSGSVAPNIASAGQIGQALQGFGGAIDNIAQRQKQIRDEERHYSTIRIGNMASEDALTFEQEARNLKGQEAFNMMDRVDEWKERATHQYTSDVEDPVIKRNVELHIQNKSLSLKNTLATYEASQRNLVSQETRMNVLSVSNKEAYLGSGTLQENLQTYENVVANDPRLSAEEKENALMAGQSAIAESRLQGIIDRNPGAAEAVIDSGFFNDYLDADKLSEFKKIANADAKRKEKEFERQQKEQLEKDQVDVANQFVKKLVDGELTQNEITKSILNPTGENSKQYWLKQLKERDKKPADGWKTDPEVEADFFTRITEDPNSVSVEELLGKQGNGLSTDTVKSLLKYRSDLADKDPLKSEVAKTAIKRVNDAKTNDLFSGDEKENSRKWAEATNLLKRYIVNNPDADPEEYVNKLLEKERDGYLRRIFESVTGVDVFESEQERLQALGVEAGPERKRQRKAPSLDEFLTKARVANSDKNGKQTVSDEELTNYYKEKYGNR